MTKSSSLHMHGGIKGKLAAAKMVTESTSGRRTWWPTPTALLSKVMEIMRGAFGTVSMGDGHVVARGVRAGGARAGEGAAPEPAATQGLLLDAIAAATLITDYVAHGSLDAQHR